MLVLTSVYVEKQGSIEAQINRYAYIFKLKTAQIRYGTVGLAFFRRP